MAGVRAVAGGGAWWQARDDGGDDGMAVGPDTASLLGGSAERLAEVGGLMSGLNEVCGQAAFVMASNLPAGLYDASYYVSARRPPDCDLYGNWVAVRTGDVPATEDGEFHFSWDGGTPSAGDTESEHRGGTCLRSHLGLDHTWGCSTHIDADATKASDLLLGVDGWFGTSAQVVLGDFNFEPGDAPMVGWAGDDRHDIFQGVTPTYEGSNAHVDYGWIDLTALEHVAGTFSFVSTSDHRQLWGAARPR